MSSFVHHPGWESQRTVQLTVHDVAKCFNVSEKTVYRWIQGGHLPAYKLNEQYRFNRAELLEWATACKVNFSSELFKEPDSSSAEGMGIADSLERGGVFYRVSGKDRESALRAVVDTMRLPEETNRDFLWQVLLAREAMASTAVGDGIAIPHVRHPIIFHVHEPIVTLCFLERAIDFGALDGEPVSTLFTMVTPTVRVHLALLARLAFALRDPSFKSAVLRQAPREDILAEAARIDASIAKPDASAGRGREAGGE